MSAPYYEDEAVTLWHGVCLDVLRSLPDASVDAVVTDPPYGLEFMGKEWDAPWKADGSVVANPADVGGFQDGNGGNPYLRSRFRFGIGAGFQQWCEQWTAECLRVLKPGGHLLAFGGTRTWHRLACAVEDAGFEVRDSIAWMYAQGFPKSMNPGRDQRFCQGCEVESDHADGTQTATEHGLSGVLLGDVSQAEGTPRGAGPVLLPSLPQQGAPAARRTEPAHDVRGGQPSLEGRGDLQAAEGQLRGAALREVSGGPAVHGEVGRLRDGAPASDGSSDRATAAEVGSGEPHQPRPTGQPTGEPGVVPEQRGSQAGRGGQVCAGCGKPPAPVGLGTALKPSFEPIVVARKPLAGTVASNVLEHGTGALNIDGCRVGDGGQLSWAEPRGIGYMGGGSDAGSVAAKESTKGRWPANVVLDESQAEALDQMSGETVSNVRTPSGKDDRGVPNTASQMVMRRNDTDPRGVADSGGASRFFPVFKEDDSCTDTTTPAASAPTLTATGAPDATHAPDTTTPSGASSAGDSGATTDLPTELMAERFRYVAKADSSERVRVDGIAHPTVKPLALMRWLVRLVTPPGGTVLEPFAGSGTTVEACILEGFKCIAIEREADYLPLIRQRIYRRRDPVEAVRGSGEDGGLFDLLDGDIA